MLKKFRYQIALFLAVVGPGFITAMVDNDSGGIYTYSAAGARWGYLPLWTLIPITILLIVTQEMCSRMGAVTGKGLSDLIREEFGLRITFLMMIALVFTNLTNMMAEFAGIASSLELFGISPLHHRPIGRYRSLVAGGEGELPKRREDVPRRVHRLCHLHHFGHSGEAGLEGSGHLQRPAGADVRGRLHHHADRDGGHVHRALDAVLSAVGRGGKRSLPRRNTSRRASK